MRVKLLDLMLLHRLSFTLLAFVSLVAAGFLVGCGSLANPETPFARASLETTPLGETLDQELDRIFAPWDSAESPGVAVVAVRGGETILRRGFGAAAPETGVMISPQRTLFSIASVTKQFTAFAILLLAQDGSLDLDADVRQYLPWFPDFGSPINSRHLLHHTSGLREYTMLATIRGEKFLEEEPFLQQDGIALIAAQQELNFPTGTEISYCNTNFKVLAELIEAISGQTVYRDLQFCFQRDGTGAVTEMQMNMTRIRGLRFVRTEPTSDGNNQPE